jgi:hypothetical protein
MGGWLWKYYIELLQKLESGNLQVLVQENVLDGVEHEADILGVGGAGDVGIQVLVSGLAGGVELLLDELCGVQKVQAAGVLGEADVEVDQLDFFAEEIGLVQEEDDRGLQEPLAVDDLIEELQ